MFGSYRFLVAYAVAVPLALMLGYLVATPDNASLAVVAMVIMFIALPLLVKWNHALLLFFWNSAFIAAFLPGEMPFWYLFALMAFSMAVVNLVMGHKSFLRAPELVKPLAFLMFVVLVTAKIRGGLGLHVLGSSSFGGKKYFLIVIGIIGYFGLISQPISFTKSGRSLKYFFLSGLSYGLVNLAFALGPFFYIIYWIITTDFVGGQVDTTMGTESVIRLGGLAPASTGLLCYILARWGVRGIFEPTKWWRILILIATVAAGALSGFRSEVIFMGLLFTIQFIMEGLWRTPLLPILVGVGLLSFVPMMMFTSKLPGSIQRSLSFLPVDINPEVRLQAEGTKDWRLEMWRVVLPEVPNYLLLGKGYSLDPVDLFLTTQASRMGLISGYEGSMIAGDYHSGPLSVVMPFGIWGVIAYVWMLTAGFKVIHSNYRFGDDRLKKINILLFSYFVAECLIFVFVFGAMESSTPVFLGILGLSVSLNGGVCRRPVVARPLVRTFSQAAPVAAM